MLFRSWTLRPGIASPVQQLDSTEAACSVAVAEAEVSLVAVVATVVVIADTVVETCVRVVDLEISQQATSQVANES